MKKKYMKPSMKAIKLESSEMICGSGDGTQSLCIGGDPNNDYDAPESTSGWGNTGIFGD